MSFGRQYTVAPDIKGIGENSINIQIFGTKKCNDTKKAQRFFKERGIKFQFIDMKEKGMSKGKFNSVAPVIKTPVVRNGRQSTIGYQPDIWKTWK